MDNYKKNQILKVEITDMGENGEGIGKVSGYTLFVKDAVIGDNVMARLTKVKKNFAYARLEEIVTPSAHRIEALCPINRQCGGCQLQTLEYKEQLRFKEAKVKNDLVRLGGQDSETIERVSESIIGMNNPYRYRNKAQYPVGYRKGKNNDNNVPNDCENVISGFYAGRTHCIIENDDCLIGCEENKDILAAIVSHMRNEGITAYDETTGKGIVRHILIRKGFATGEIMICIVLNLHEPKSFRQEYDGQAAKDTSKFDCEEDGYKKAVLIKVSKHLKNIEKLITRLSEIRGVSSISVNLNSSRTNVILGNRCITLWGSGTISDYIGDIRFKISPLSFLQVNPVQTKKLYDKALEFANLKGNETVWDLYCGIGTISLFFARHAKKVYGVEIIEQAVTDAKENAKLNGIENAEFIAGAAENIVVSDFLKRAATENMMVSDFSDGAVAEDIVPSNAIILQDMPDVIVVDPPRKGCDEALLNTILSVKPSKIIYISCNPATLARDIKYLTMNNKNGLQNENGIALSNKPDIAKYEIKALCPIDLFPQTVHVECVVLMSRNDT